jgi:glycosyltransferase involved in cell wall biosynthesis
MTFAQETGFENSALQWQFTRTAGGTSAGLIISQIALHDCLLSTMKIEYVTSARLEEASAPALHVRGVSRAFQRAGHDVKLICPKPLNPDGVRWDEFRRRHYPFSPRRGGWRVFQTLVAAHLQTAAIRRDLPDLYYLRFSPGALIARTLGRLPRPKALELNGLEYLRSHDASGMLRNSDFILVGTTEMKEAVQRRFPDLAARLIVQSNTGIDPMDIAAIGPHEARKIAGLPTDAYVALILTGFQPHQDFETAFTALAKVRAGKAVIVLIAGDGPRLREAQSAAVKWSDRMEVRFAGQISGRLLSACISASDVCINLLSRTKLLEGNGKAQKTIDYLAYGRPVIESVTRERPVPPWLNTYAFPVIAEDADSVSAALEWTLRHPAESDRKASAGREFVMAEFTWSYIIRKFLREIEGNLK